MQDYIVSCRHERTQHTTAYMTIYTMEKNTTTTSTSTAETAAAHIAVDLPVASPPPPPTTILSLLTGFHAGYFRISLSLSAQALLWKTLATSNADLPPSPLHRAATTLPSVAFDLLWCLALCAHAALCLLYLLRLLLRFRRVRAEFSHRVGVNYLFAPWVTCLLLLRSAPFLRADSAACATLWWAFCLPLLALDVKVYGQWFTQGKRFLSMVANPTSLMTVVANMVAAWVAAGTGRREAAIFMFSLGVSHYLVLFVTLYQRFIGSDRLPAALRPVYFLFFAAPGVGSLAWGAIAGGFDTGSKMLFFLSLFLFASLVSRPALFKKAMTRFDVAWWAYSFPLTALAIASTEYANAVRTAAADGLMMALSVLSVVVSLVLMGCTVLNAGSLAPRDPFELPAKLNKRSSKTGAEESSSSTPAGSSVHGGGSDPSCTPDCSTHGAPDNV